MFIYTENNRILQSDNFSCILYSPALPPEKNCFLLLRIVFRRVVCNGLRQKVIDFPTVVSFASMRRVCFISNDHKFDWKNIFLHDFSKIYTRKINSNWWKFEWEKSGKFRRQQVKLTTALIEGLHVSFSLRVSSRFESNFLDRSKVLKGQWQMIWILNFPSQWTCHSFQPKLWTWAFSYPSNVTKLDWVEKKVGNMPHKLITIFDDEWKFCFHCKFSHHQTFGLRH